MNDPVRSDEGLDINIGPLHGLVDGEGVKVTVGETEIAVFRVDESVWAIADRCSHAEASLAEGELFGTHVECPRHGAEFDITTGKQLSLPATKPVRTFDTRIVDGDVVVLIHEEAS
jgi:3-phenylpropionate/trans-cinnamate dioxygenase ferredoxin component